MHVRKGDLVEVISGNDRGKRGSIKAVLRERNRVIVEGVNLRWKHRKPNQKNPKGERTQIECAIHASNVLLVDPESDRTTRRRPEAAGKGASGAKVTKSPRKKKEASAAS